MGMGQGAWSPSGIAFGFHGAPRCGIFDRHGAGNRGQAWGRGQGAGGGGCHDCLAIVLLVLTTLQKIG